MGLIFKKGDIVQLKRNLHNKKRLIEEVGEDIFNKNLRIVKVVESTKSFTCFGDKYCESFDYYECKILEDEQRDIQVCKCEIEHNMKEKINKLIKYG